MDPGKRRDLDGLIRNGYIPSVQELAKAFSACAFSKFGRRACSAFRASVSGPYATSLQTYRW